MNEKKNRLYNTDSSWLRNRDSDDETESPKLKPFPIPICQVSYDSIYDDPDFWRAVYASVYAVRRRFGKDGKILVASVSSGDLDIVS